MNDDLISRQAAIDALYHVDEYNGRSVEAIRNLPSARPERIRGRWIYGEDSIADCVDGYRCDQCGLFVPWDYQHKSIDYIKDYNFCPNCGADMREVAT
jgi:DNA-directed RNA polymerase subunit RPC12/RpoP